MIQANVNDVRKFITFAAKELKLPSLPSIKLVGSQENKFAAFGHSKGSVIIVRVTERHPIDICRTLAHELLHYKQNILGIREGENVKEDQANMVAGRILRKFDIAHPEVFKDKAIRANMMHEAVLQGCGGNVSGSSGVQGYDPVMSFGRKRGKGGEFGLKNLFHRKQRDEKPLNNIIGHERKLDK